MVPPTGTAPKTVITFSRRGRHQAAGRSAPPQCHSPRELSDCDPHSQESESIAFTEASPGSPSTLSDGKPSRARANGPRLPQQSPSQPVRKAAPIAADPFAFPDEPDVLVPLPAALQSLAGPESSPEKACLGDKSVSRLEDNEPAGSPLPIRRHPILKPPLARPLSGPSPGTMALPAAAAQRCSAPLQLPAANSSPGQRGSAGSQPGAGCIGNAVAEASGRQHPAAEALADTLHRGLPDWLQPTAGKCSRSTETAAPRAHQSGGAQPARAPAMLLGSKRKAATLELEDVQVCPSVWLSCSAWTSCCASGTYGLAMGQQCAVPGHCCSLLGAQHTHRSHIWAHAGCMGWLHVTLHEPTILSKLQPGFHAGCPAAQDAGPAQLQRQQQKEIWPPGQGRW